MTAASARSALPALPRWHAGGVWLTDANGREMQQRARDYRPSFELGARANWTSHRLALNMCARA